jgi:hypothetical protein
MEKNVYWHPMLIMIVIEGAWDMSVLGQAPTACQSEKNRIDQKNEFDPGIKQLYKNTVFY